jgi:hypothetical protein
MNAEPIIDTVGTPICSATALARNTAGAQLPQAPMPEIMASQPWLRIWSASPLLISFDLAPWKLPNTE